LKLHEHVATLKSAIENAYDKEFSRLGFGKNKVLSIEHIPVENQARRQRFESMLESHIGETGDYEHAREKLVDELTFTLFNRLAAVKVMEAANLFPPIITRRAEHGGRSFGHKAWLESNPHERNEELEGLRNYIKAAFDELGTSLPLFSSDYPFSLFPDTIGLNEIIELFNAVEQDSQLDDNIWGSDDILGWCYESYNNSKKKELKDSGQKIEYNYVSLQSQVYTPRWVVQFLVDNSLGKLYLEMFPDSGIQRQFKIANAPDKRERDPKPLHTVKIIDPACGSGNFLLYAFDLFYDLYLDQIENYGADYAESDIPKLIIENNLHGIDLDDRAVQLAQLGLFIKASKRTRSISEINFRVVSSDFYLPDYPEVAHVFEANSELGQKQKELVSEIWEDLQYAYKFGSLIRIKEKVERRLQSLFGQQGGNDPSFFSETDLGLKPKAVQADAFFEQDVATEREFISSFFTNLRSAVDQYAQSEKNSFTACKTQDAITFLELLTTEYDVATANPPYTDSSDFGIELKKFIEDNYKKPFKFHTNLYATFIKRCYELANDDGKIALIHPHTFMFIKTFEDVRKFMINKCHIDVMVDFGLDRVNLFGPGILLDATFYILSKKQSQREGLYFNLSSNLQEKFKRGKFLEALDDFISGEDNDRVYTLDQSKLKIIKSWPFIYWISNEFREKFKSASIDNYFKVSQGMSVSNGERFLRFNWELNSTDIFSDNKSEKCSWARFPKGGPYKKWSGNLWLCVNWKNGGAELKSYSKAVLRNQNYYFVEGLTYSSSGSKGTTFRVLPSSAVISGGGPGVHKADGIYSNNYCMGYLNSKFVAYIINCLNPTVNTTQGDLNRIPFLDIGRPEIQQIENYVERNIQISNHLLGYSLIELNYLKSPLYFIPGDIKLSIREYLSYENHLLSQSFVNEALIDNEILSSVPLPDTDKMRVLEKEGRSIGGLAVDSRARNAYLVELGATTEFSLGYIQNHVASLQEKEFHDDEINRIRKEFSNLYQKNNDLEEFCTRHRVNPINIWYWFKQSDVIPKQRMHTLAMEFLVDLVREILMEDEDGMIPLIPNAGEKVLVDRIEEKFNEKGFGSAQYSNFDSVLGRPIPEYLNIHFFAELSDHLNLFMYLPKTPFIWHLSSGPDQGFDCYISIYKWSRDNLMRLRSVYIEHRERALINRQSDLAENQSASAQTEKDLIFRQLHEIDSFKSKIDELLAEGYDPILDDGVGMNIAPLQKKGMIPYEVLNPGQLKKYLNADW
jgi:type I restriction-modification system DNA methylase subunit